MARTAPQQTTYPTAPAAPILRNLQIQTLPLAALTPYARNPRRHSKAQIRQIADSIRAFGWTNPILIDTNRTIVAGHGRYAAAQLLGLATVPTLALEDLSEAQIRAYIIADNKLAENAGWDRELLSLELQGLAELDFDLDLLGFETAELDLLLVGDVTDSDPADALPDVNRSSPPVTRVGDLWLLDDHRLFCGNALEDAAYGLLMGPDKAQLICTDPPYNVPIAGHVSGLGQIQHREFAMASGEMTRAEFTGFLESVFRQLIARGEDGALHYVFMDWRHMAELLTAAEGLYGELKNLCVWNKSNGGMGSLYRSKHELVFVFKQGSAPHINNVELGRHGRNRSNVWDYGGQSSFGGDRQDLKLHPTVKPVALLADLILDASHRGQIVLDPFGGSGSTLLAAERTHRRARLMELDPGYCDVILRRWQDLTGGRAHHQQTGRSFAELTEIRAAETASGETASEEQPHE